MGRSQRAGAGLGARHRVAWREYEARQGELFLLRSYDIIKHLFIKHLSASAAKPVAQALRYPDTTPATAKRRLAAIH